jgi:four helix bundle protein
MYFLEDLELWRYARKFRNNISKLVKKFPYNEKYRLTDQLLRSSRSVSANVAEGFGRFHYQENIQFCRQARGSLLEVLDHLYVALDEEYINSIKFDELRQELLFCLKLLNGYIRYLKSKKE